MLAAHIAQRSWNNDKHKNKNLKRDMIPRAQRALGNGLPIIPLNSAFNKKEILSDGDKSE